VISLLKGMTSSGGGGENFGGLANFDSAKAQASLDKGMLEDIYKQNC
jgi:hypothetical protein